MSATFETLMGLDRQLEQAGHHPLTPWWREQYRRFYSHPTAKTFVGRAGRGSAKSHSSTKVGLNETVFGDWKIGPGERHVWAFVSRTKDEASQRLALIESFLRALRVGFDTAGDQIALRDMPRGFRVFACQVAAVSGFRCYGYSADELAKWTNADHSANPAEEVCASLDAMSITHEGARRLLISSPLGMVDYHHERFELGNTADQVVARAATWEANPSVTREQTRKQFTNERIWLREAAAIPQAGATSAFDGEAVDAAFALEPMGEPSRRIVVLDPSSGRKDAWAWGVCGWRWPESAPSVLTFDLIDGVSSGFFSNVKADDIVERVVKVHADHDALSIHSDQREAFMLESAFSRHDLSFIRHDWTSASKPEAVERLRRLFAEGRISLPAHEALRKELLSFEERITPTGALTFGARGSGHDDFVALLLTAVMAIGDDGEYRPGDLSRQLSRINGRLYGAGEGALGLNEPPLPNRRHSGTRWGDRGRGFG